MRLTASAAAAGWQLRERREVSQSLSVNPPLCDIQSALFRNTATPTWAHGKPPPLVTAAAAIAATSGAAGAAGRAACRNQQLLLLLLGAAVCGRCVISISNDDSDICCVDCGVCHCRCCCRCRHDLLRLLQGLVLHPRLHTDSRV